MPTDLRIQLPTPAFKVEQLVEGRKHFYQVTQDNGQMLKFPGVTGSLGIIAKPQLIPWANNQGLSSVVAAMIAKMNGKKANQEMMTTIADIIKDSKKASKLKKSGGLADELAVRLGGAFVLGKKKSMSMTFAVLGEMMQDAIEAPDRMKDEAADLGTQAHAYFESFIQGQEPMTINPAIKPAVDAFKSWMATSGLNIVQGDTDVASIVHGYGGALDALAVDEEGAWVLMDWKTSNGTYDEYALQVAAYAQALKETYGIECHRAIVIRFSKTEPVEFEQKEVKNLRVSFNGFMNAKRLKDSMAEEHFICPAA